MKIDILKLIPIDDLMLNTRARNCLVGNNIFTLYDLLHYKDEISCIPNLGPRSLEEIVTAVYYFIKHYHIKEFIPWVEKKTNRSFENIFINEERMNLYNKNLKDMPFNLQFNNPPLYNALTEDKDIIKEEIISIENTINFLKNLIKQLGNNQ